PNAPPPTPIYTPSLPDALPIYTDSAADNRLILTTGTTGGGTLNGVTIGNNLRLDDTPDGAHADVINGLTVNGNVAIGADGNVSRSEERRVGKECGSGGARLHGR